MLLLLTNASHQLTQVTMQLSPDCQNRDTPRTDDETGGPIELDPARWRSLWEALELVQAGTQLKSGDLTITVEDSNWETEMAELEAMRRQDSERVPATARLLVDSLYRQVFVLNVGSRQSNADLVFSDCTEFLGSTADGQLFVLNGHAVDRLDRAIRCGDIIRPAPERGFA